MRVETPHPSRVRDGTRHLERQDGSSSWTEMAEDVVVGLGHVWCVCEDACQNGKVQYVTGLRAAENNDVASRIPSHDYPVGADMVIVSLAESARQISL